MSKAIGMLVAVWLPIGLGVLTALALALWSERKKPDA